MKLRAKLFVPLLVFSLLFFAYIQYIWLPRVSHAMQASALQDRQAHLTSIAEGLIPLLLESQLANVYESLDALHEENSDWISIKLTNNKGLRLYPLDEPQSYQTDSESLRILTQPVGFLSPMLAELEVVMDFAPVFAEITALGDSLRNVLLMMLAAIVTVTVVLFEWLIHKRLRQLSDAAVQLTHGDYDAYLPKKNGDEIGDLVGSFMAMRNALHAYYSQLKGEIDSHRHTAAALKEEKERATYQATHDSLTGLVNRHEFEHLLSDALKDAQHYEDEHALLYMDLDQFKIVNDTCGHIAGDALLQQLKIILQDQMRRQDKLARLGGDEFGVLLKYCDLENAVKVAKTLLRTIQEFHFTWDGKTFSIGVSIGVVCIEKQSRDINYLLSAADSACYMAKDNGRNRVQIYQRSNKELTKQKGEMLWVTKLVEAMDMEKFELYSQSIIALEPLENEPIYQEILLRLREDNDNITPPGAFIPAAERYNLITSLDRWVVKKTFQFLKEWTSDREIILSINLSGPTLDDQRLLDYIESCLRHNEVAGQQLCFEITE
ncbi:MAG: diguanylate cyclase, partial [Candidatus Thiodiazotropha sp.]